MPLFTILTDDNAGDLLEKIFNSIPDLDWDYLQDIVESLLEDKDTEYALGAGCGCLLIRAFDGKYSFPYPVAVCEEADPMLAATELRDYAVKEDIPLIYTDVPSEELGGLLPLFRHANIDAADKYAESYTVSIITEVSALDEIPRIYIDDITLDALRPEDDIDYARLCKDEETNRYWGYDYREDIEDPKNSYFRENAEAEFARGVSMSFAVRLEDDFVGEAVLYAFNGAGSCDCAIRILPEYRGRGIAGSVLEKLKEFAADIGLNKLCSRVMKENEPSRMLCLSHLDFQKQLDEKTILFYSDL